MDSSSSPQSPRQACSSPSDHSWTSDWSDPRDVKCSSSSTSNTGTTASNSTDDNDDAVDDEEEAGILVPALLQQLFGVDFLPSPTAAALVASTTTLLQQRHYLRKLAIQDGDSSLASLSPPELRISSSAEEQQQQSEKDLLYKDQSDPVLFHGKSQSVDAVFMEEEEEQKIRCRRQRNKRLITALRKAFNNNKKKEANAAAEGTQTNRQQRQLHNKSGATATAATPRRKGSSTPRSLLRESLMDEQGATKHRSSSSSSSSNHTTQWIQKQMEIMQQHQSHLARVNAESQQVQERALLIQNNISSIQSEVSHLQQALQSCLFDLQKQVTDLNATKNRLGCLEEEASRASDNVEQAVRALCKKTGRGGTKMRLFRQNNNNNQRHRSFTADSYPSIETFLVTDSNVETKDSSSFVPPSEEDNSSSNSCNNKISHSVTATPPPLQYNRRRASTEPPRHSSSSFMRVNDLELEKSVSSTHSSLQDSPGAPADTDGDFFFIDHDIPLVMEQLFKLGYDVVTDESERFEPTRETRRLLQQQQRKQVAMMQPIVNWPIYPWYAVDDSDDVYVWTGGVPHRGFGHDWPVVKARTLIRAAPRAVLDVLLDSSQIKKYNKMSQGREDVLILQEGVETISEESQYGFAGDARIMRALNKPRLFPKTIEMLSLWYSQQLKNAPGSYMTVSRSVWEDELGHGSNASNDKTMLRSEMLLGVTLLRPCPYGCEITTITHVFSPGVPEIMAKRSTPGSAANLLRDIQSLFPKKT